MPVKRRRRRETTLLEETASDRFERLAKARLEKAREAMRLLENLSRTATYEYTEEQVESIIKSLMAGVHGVRKSFVNGEPTRYMLAMLSGFRPLKPRKGDSGNFRDDRTPRERQLDRNKQGRRFTQRRLGVGPR